MGSLVVLDRHLWLTLMDIRDAEKAVLWNVPISPSGPFGSSVESLTKQFSKSQKQSRVIKHFMPKCTSQPPPAPHLLKALPLDCKPIKFQSPTHNQTLRCIPRTRGINDTRLLSITDLTYQGMPSREIAKCSFKMIPLKWILSLIQPRE